MSASDLPEAAPADSAGTRGSFGQPADSFHVGGDDAPAPATAQDPAPVRDERPGLSLWVAVVIAVLALGAGFYAYFLAIGQA